MRNAHIVCWSWDEASVKIVHQGRQRWCKVHTEPGGRLYCICDGESLHLMFV